MVKQPLFKFRNLQFSFCFGVENCYIISLQPELVEFYYLWKKTPGANNNRPHRRRRAGSLRRNRVTRASNVPSNNKKEETPEPSATVNLAVFQIGHNLKIFLVFLIFLGSQTISCVKGGQQFTY